MNWRSLVLAISLLSSLLAGGGDFIRVGVSEWGTLNPLLMAQDTDVEAVDLLFDRLVTLNDKGEFIPELLESWTINHGGREVILKLRPGMTWHDGRPIEAADVVFTWTALRLPRVRQVADTIEGVTSFDRMTAEGPLTVRISLKRPRGSLLADLYAFIPVPRHRYQVGPKPALDPINFQPVGSGPYRLVGKGTPTRILMERWAGYRGVHPGQAPGFEVWDPSGEKAILPVMRQERLHFAHVSGFRYYLVRKGVQGSGLVQALSTPLASYDAFFLNCDPKLSLLGDRALRQAIGELVPWEDVVRGLRFFPTQLATSFWPPESWAHDFQPRPLPQVERAAAILEGAGWKLGPDGLRHDAKGRPLSLVLYDVPPSTKLSPARRLVVQAAKVGMRIEVKVLPFQEVSRKGQRHEGDLWSFGWSLALDPDSDSPLFTRAGYQTKANISSYLNPEIDRLFDEGRHTLDPVARKGIYLQISDLIYRDKPVIPITYAQSRLLVHRRLKGVAFNSLGQTFGFWPGQRGWRLDP